MEPGPAPLGRVALSRLGGVEAAENRKASLTEGTRVPEGGPQAPQATEGSPRSLPAPSPQAGPAVPCVPCCRPRWVPERPALQTFVMKGPEWVPGQRHGCVGSPSRPRAPKACGRIKTRAETQKRGKTISGCVFRASPQPEHDPFQPCQAKPCLPPHARSPHSLPWDHAAG